MRPAGTMSPGRPTTRAVKQSRQLWRSNTLDNFQTPVMVHQALGQLECTWCKVSIESLDQFTFERRPDLPTHFGPVCHDCRPFHKVRAPVVSL